VKLLIPADDKKQKNHYQKTTRKPSTFQQEKLS
jgi:hypothetical protein